MHTRGLKKFLYTYMFVCITLIGSIIIFFDIDVINSQGIVILTFILNGMIMLFQLSKSSSLGYSLKDILFLFMFVFMFISPLIQYLENVFPWWDTYLFTDEKIIYANLIIMLFMVVYICGYKISFNKKIRSDKFKSRRINSIKLVMNIFFVITVLCSMYIIVKTGIGNLFARSTNSLNIKSSSFSLIVSISFRSVPVIYVAMNLLYAIKNKRIYRKIPFILGSILMFIVNFPTGTARFWMASVYLGLLIIIMKKLGNPHLFKILIFIGILLIFPAVNSFRNNTIQMVINNGINIPKPSDAFLAGDFDSYSMLVRAIIYVKSHGITWGNQLLGNILFFIPRQIWPNKPIGSGAFIASKLGWNFTNVSCPYIGEGYINFGILGVIVFAMLLSIISKFADESYARLEKSKGEYISFIEIVYPFSIGFLFFILRGDLLSSLSFYIGFMVPVIILWFKQLFKLSSNFKYKEFNK